MNAKAGEDEEAGGGDAQDGQALAAPKPTDKKSHHGASRMDAMMEKYHKQTSEMHRKQEAAATKQSFRPSSRGPVDKSAKARVRRWGVRPTVFLAFWM